MLNKHTIVITIIIINRREYVFVVVLKIFGSSLFFLEFYAPYSLLYKQAKHNFLLIHFQNTQEL